MYYVLIKAKRKNAKRHIAGKYETYSEALRNALYIHSKYVVEIADGRWNVKQTLNA